MFIYGHINPKKYTKVFCPITRQNSIRAKIININRKIYIIWFKQEIFGLFGLTEDLFNVIRAKTSLIMNSIIEKADEASAGEKR